MFRIIIICVCLLTITIDVVQSKQLELPPGFKLHPVISTWEEANEQCKSEGAMLASPINNKVFSIINSVMEVKRLTYHTGMKAHNGSGKYVSIEGIPFEDTPAVMSGLVQQLDRSHGDCLSMNRNIISVIPCWTELPYICYNSQIFDQLSCGPIEEGYVYEMATGSCYKLYTAGKRWYTAQDKCTKDGGHLVIIDNAEEAKSLKKIHAPLGDHYVHIGLADYGNGDWRSIYGKPVEQLYNTWYEGRKPNNPDYLYGVLRLDGKLEYTHDADRAFICERQPNL